MNELRKQSDGSVVNEAVFRRSHNISFPNPLTDESAIIAGYNLLLEGTKPTASTVYEEVVRDGEEQISGKWYTKYKVVTNNTSDIDTTTATVQRKIRDERLAETDFYALSDVTMSTDMSTYRQALRDMPTASGWPHTHTWPTKPS